MLPRERIQAALDFQPVDVVPLQIAASTGGLYEHGQKLLDLMKSLEHDFSDQREVKLPAPPPPGDFDPDGRYHAIKTDEWGTTWEYRIFGVWGHPLKWPLNDLENLPAYRAPGFPACSGPDFEKAKEQARRHRQRYFQVSWAGELLERMRAVRRYEDVMMDVELDTPEINRIADLIVERYVGFVKYALALDADGVNFGDDQGTSTGLMFSPATFRRFFKPRYRALFEPVVKAGKKVFFHSCGQVGDLLEDLRDMGVRAIWPQLPLYNLKELSRRCRELGLAVQLHPDRGDLMQRGTPRQVRDYVLRMLDHFDTRNGGSWLFLEIDPGFPWANVEALFEVARAVRTGKT